MILRWDNQESEKEGKMMAGLTGLEPAAFGVTGRRYNQLNYNPFIWWAIQGSNL